MYHFILNSGISDKHSQRIQSLIQKQMEERHLPFQIHMPGSKEALLRLVQSLTDPDDTAENETVHLVIVGGDGTLNLAFQGIRSFSNTTLSCIPFGSGNDFARNMNIPKDPEKALCHLLESPEEISLDYGLAVYTDSGNFGTTAYSKRFLFACGMGYDADICTEANTSRLKKFLNKLKLGQIIYLLVGIRQIFTRQCPKAVIQIDSDIPMIVSSLFFTVGMIHTYEGGGVPFCPDADPTDGLLDVCQVQKMSRLKLFLAVILVYLKKHTIFQNIDLTTCKKIQIHTDTPQWFHVDGEADRKTKDLTISVEGTFRLLR